MMSDTIDLHKPHRPIRAGVVLMQSKTEILDVAPIDLLHAISKDTGALADILPLPDHVKAQAVDIEFYWVNESGNLANLTSGIQIQATHSFATAPRLDIVLYGAHSSTYTPNAAELAYARKIYNESAAFLTICGGLLVPLQAGLLEGKNVVDLPYIDGKTKSRVPDATFHQKRWHRDGKLWTGGVLLNGLDLMVGFVREYFPGELTEFAIKTGEYADRGSEF